MEGDIGVIIGGVLSGVFGGGYAGGCGVTSVQELKLLAPPDLLCNLLSSSLNISFSSLSVFTISLSINLSKDSSFSFPLFSPPTPFPLLVPRVLLPSLLLLLCTTSLFPRFPTGLLDLLVILVRRPSGSVGRSAGRIAWRACSWSALSDHHGLPAAAATTGMELDLEAAAAIIRALGS